MDKTTSCGSLSPDRLPLAEADAILRRLTPVQKLGQLFLASIEVEEMDGATEAFLREYCVGNVILFGKNCRSRGQLVRLNRRIQAIVTEATGQQALLAIDQEGGPVLRILNGASVFPCAMLTGATGDPENAYLIGRMAGDELRTLGIGLDLAPVLDVNGTGEEPLLGRRSYGATCAETALYGGAFARGLREAGVLDCGEHFPGHGFTRIDTHFAFGVDDSPAEKLENELLEAFRQVMAEGLCSLMSTHMCFPALEPEMLPSTLSRRILTGLAREKLGFKGLIISDGMLMHAISKTYGSPCACVMAVQAGCDLVITGNGGLYPDADGLRVQEESFHALREAMENGALPMARIDDAARRVIAFKLLLGDLCPAADAEERDWSAHAAFFDALALQGVTIHRQAPGALPVPPGALYVSERPAGRLGVAEGDRLIPGFAAVAAEALHGDALEYTGIPDTAAIRKAAEKASAMVIAIETPQALEAIMPAVQAVHTAGTPIILAVLNAPWLGWRAMQEACFDAVISSYDKTEQAIRAVCRRMTAAGR